MRKFIIAALMLALPATAQARSVGKDGYAFEVAQRETTAFTVRMVYYRSQRELTAALKARSPDMPERDVVRLKAFSTLKADGSSCTIHTLHPSVSHSPEWIGHELMHCSLGEWHPMAG